MSGPNRVQEPRRRLRWLLVVVGLCLLLPLAAAEPRKGKISAVEQQAKLKERNRLIAEGNKLLAAGKLGEAIADAEKVLALAREVFGDKAAAVVESLQWLANLHERGENFAAAGEKLREVRDIQTARYGKDHWRVLNARLDLADVELREKMSREQRQQVREANSLLGQASQLNRQGKAREALPLADKARRIRQDIYGVKHRHHATALNWVGILYWSMGAYAKAETLYRQALDIYKQALGDKHPDYATSMDNLALLYQSMGAYAKAEPLYRQALDIRKQVLGDKH
ncbi:MAG TPA: tetratricopeptide repeat protein, partial [Gemmataceae bacterium]|nr:tetratricopeptide repeat protein [Gemmataceae bacterium]